MELEAALAKEEFLTMVKLVIHPSDDSQKTPNPKKERPFEVTS
jgi:hypothetical protein